MNWKFQEADKGKITFVRTDDSYGRFTIDLVFVALALAIIAISGAAAYAGGIVAFLVAFGIMMGLTSFIIALWRI